MELQDFSSNFYNEADTTVTIKQIAKGLKANLKRKFPDRDNTWLDEKTERILETNGIDFNHFNFIHVIEKVISEQLNDVSIDDNSNKNEKTIAGIFAEAIAPIKKVVGFDYLYRVMKEMYGKQRAKRLASNMYDYSIGLSDSTNILLPYCYALDASKLVTIGREFGQLPSGPSKRISSYISALCESVHQLSSHFAGAIAIGTFFFDIAHLAFYKQNLTLDQITNDPKCRKHFENEFQQFVHSVNHLSRNSNESPFTNVSIFDKVKLRHIVSEDLAWYFPNPHEDKELHGDIPVTKDMWLDFITDYIYEIQNIFLDFFDKGDPINNGTPYRFPVVTTNFSKVLLNGEWTLEDENFLENITSRDVYRYNIFTSEGTRVASCCFRGNERIQVISPEGQKINLFMKDFVNMFSTDSHIEDKIPSGWKIISMNEKFEEEIVEITGILKKKNHTGELITIKCNGESISVTPDHIFNAYDKNLGSVLAVTARDILKEPSRFKLPLVK